MKSALLALAALLLVNGSESGSSSTRRRSPAPAPAPSSQPIDFDCPEEFGYYAHPSDCTQYYVCVFGGALLESCTGGLMYSHELQTCDWPRNVGCAPGTASQVQQVPETRPRQRAQQSHQSIPKHDLYTEEEQLGPAEELETDRQQRVYRGQPPTIGQVASDRDAIPTHSNAIPIPSGGRDKLSVVSYGTQQQYTSPQDTGRENFDGPPISWSAFQPRILHRHPQYTQNTQNNYRQNTYLRRPPPPVEYKFEPSDARVVQPTQSTYQTTPRIVHFHRPTSHSQYRSPQTKYPTYQSTTARNPPIKHNSTQQSEEESEEEDEEEDYDDEEEETSEESEENKTKESNENASQPEGGFKPSFPEPPDGTFFRESSTEEINPFASHDFDFDKFISELRTQAVDPGLKTTQYTTPRYTNTPMYTSNTPRTPHLYMGPNLIPSKGVKISSMYQPIAYLITTTPATSTSQKASQESDEYEDEYYDDYDDYDNKTISPPKPPKRLQHLDNKDKYEDDDGGSSDYDSDEYYDEDEEEESEEQSEKPVTEVKSASMTEKTKIYLDPTTPKYVLSTTNLVPKCTNRGRNKCPTTQKTTPRTRYRSTTQKIPQNTTQIYTKRPVHTPITEAVLKKQRLRQNRNKNGETDSLVTKHNDKGHTQRAITKLRASVTPQQQYVEQQTSIPSRNYTQSRYVPTQYDTPYYNIYDDEVDLYKEIANGDYQYNQNSNQYRPQYKEKKPQIEIVQQEPRQTYSKSKYNTQSDIYQSVTPQEYDTYSIQTNDDIPYRQPVQQKTSSRSGVKESDSDGKESVSTASPGLAQEEAKPTIKTDIPRGPQAEKLVQDFVQTVNSPSPFRLNDEPSVSSQTRGHFIVREPEPSRQTVNITPKPRIIDPRREETKRPIAIRVPTSAIDLNRYQKPTSRPQPIRDSEAALVWFSRDENKGSVKVQEERRQRTQDDSDRRGASRFQESAYELEDFTTLPDELKPPREDKIESRDYYAEHQLAEDRARKAEDSKRQKAEEAKREEARRKAYEDARIKQIEEAERQAKEELQQRQREIEEYRRKQYEEEQDRKQKEENQRRAAELRMRQIEAQKREEARKKEIEDKRKKEAEEARKKEIEEIRRKEIEEEEKAKAIARRREIEEARRKQVEETRRREIEEEEKAKALARKKEIEETRRKQIEETRQREIEEQEQAKRQELEQAERSRMEAIRKDLERKQHEETRKRDEIRRKQERIEEPENNYYYQTKKASSRIPQEVQRTRNGNRNSGFRIVVDLDDEVTTRRSQYTTDSKPPKKYLNRNNTLVNELYLNEQSTRPITVESTSLPSRMYTDQIRKTLDTPIPLSKTDPDKTVRVRPTSYDTQSTPGLTRGNSRHRGSHTYTVSPNEAEPANRGTPASRGRPTLKPSTTVVGKASEYIDIYRFPPNRPSNIYPTPQVDKTAAKCRKDVCLLPDCSCGGKDIPGDLSPEETPQLVLLTFDDSVNDLNKGLYSDLFEKNRVNPNGCPISATFYVSHEWTDYSQVQNLYSTGHEIASHSVSHSFGEQFSQKKWTKEIAGQREILAAYGGVKLEDVRGMRAPFLAVGGNKMFKMLYDSNFTYDSSMPVYENRPPSWPYTLDYKIFHDCMIPPCPSRSYPGVWEVPMVMWQDLNGGRCSMGDACSNPPNAEGVYKMLIKNFERHFTTNRSPFGLFYHAAWFTQPHHKEGFIAFLDAINKMPEVWLVTNWQAIQWIRDPTPISRLNNFAPFQCNYQDRPKKCNNPKVCNLWHKSGVRYMRTCQPCPDVYPWTGKSGVRNSRVDNEIIQE